MFQFRYEVSTLTSVSLQRYFYLLNIIRRVLTMSLVIPRPWGQLHHHFKQTLFSAVLTKQWFFAFSCSVFRDLLQREEQLQKECRSQDKRKRKKFQLSLSRLSWPKGILSIVIQFFCDVTKFSAAGHPKNLIQFFFRQKSFLMRRLNFI